MGNPSCRFLYLVECVEVQHVLSVVEALLRLPPSVASNLFNVFPLVDVEGLVSEEEGGDVLGPRKPAGEGAETRKTLAFPLLYEYNL